MKARALEVRDLSEAFFCCCKLVYEHGYTYTIDRGSSVGRQRKELDFITLQITNPGLRPLAPDIPIGIPAPTNDDVIEEYLQYLITPVKAQNELYTYGEDLAPQVDKVIEIYKADGYNTNQMTMMVGDKHSIDLEHSQCLRLIDTRIRYGKLHFIIYFRSWDLWAGLPTNLGGFQLLKEYMAKQIGVDDGEIIACSKGLHLYDHCWEFAKNFCRRDSHFDENKC